MSVDPLRNPIKGNLAESANSHQTKAFIIIWLAEGFTTKLIKLRPCDESKGDLT